MNYALLIYITPEQMKGLSSEETRSLHGDYEAAAPTSARVIAHYRLRPPQLTTTVRKDGDTIERVEGASSETSEGLRALYLLESDEPDAVLDFASQHPAVGIGGTAEVWPLIAPGRHGSRIPRPSPPDGTALTGQARDPREPSRGRLGLGTTSHRDTLTPSLQKRAQHSTRTWPDTRIPLTIGDPRRRDGAFMEPSGRNQWQSVANGRPPKTAQTSQFATDGNPRQPFRSMVRRGSPIRRTRRLTYFAKLNFASRRDKRTGPQAEGTRS